MVNIKLKKLLKILGITQYLLRSTEYIKQNIKMLIITHFSDNIHSELLENQLIQDVLFVLKINKCDVAVLTLKQCYKLPKNMNKIFWYMGVVPDSNRNDMQLISYNLKDLYIHPEKKRFLWKQIYDKYTLNQFIDYHVLKK